MTDNEKRAIKMRNTRLENLAFNGSKKQQHKKWKIIAQELSDRCISLSDIANEDSPKQAGLMQLAEQEKMTLGELVMLKQYAVAIEDGSTKAAEFIRDTKGEKPSTQLDMNDVSDTGISKLSMEELLELKDALMVASNKKIKK